MLSFRDGGTIDRDLGGRKILAQAKEFNGAVVESGLFAGDRRPEGSELTVAQIGAVHEFGSKDGRIPERSWLRRAVRENGPGWQRSIDEMLDGILRGRGQVFPSLIAFGERVASDIRATIDKVLTPPKAESTLRAEGGPLKRTKTGRVKKGAREFQARFTHPLIWTGLMRALVRSRVALLGRVQMTRKGGKR